MNHKLATLIVGAVFISGCRFYLDPGISMKHSENNFIYMPDMVYSQAIKAQEEGGMRYPVKGTIPREKLLYSIPETQDEAAKTLKNPLKKTFANLKRGQEVFNIYCIACHGSYGEGNGGVVPKYPQPPSLQSDKIKGYFAKGEEGRVFHIISKGQNIMPSYATQIEPMDRWKVVMYLQALHRAKNPTAEDIKAYEGN
ncbi:MAG: cytochrome c [Xanthomonadaceae bacterium]|nr:cytochrome c [Xanthomonadaceae bacterium]